MASLFKKTEVELELLTNIDILLMVKKETEYVIQYVAMLKQIINV